MRYHKTANYTRRYYIGTGGDCALDVPPGWDYIIIGPAIMPYTTTTGRDNADMSRNYSHIGHY
ncbi:MAG: hypothetical protein WC455_30280 [Dehalococcoidia bacterium]|jgi:hypothetical protein